MFMKETIAKLYDRAAPGYGEKGCSFFGYFGKRLVEISNVKSSDKVLDVATGTGSVILPLQDYLKDGDAIGIDISEKMLEKCQIKAKKLGYELDLRVMDAENLEFEDNSFDFIFC